MTAHGTLSIEKYYLDCSTCNLFMDIGNHLGKMDLHCKQVFHLYNFHYYHSDHIQCMDLNHHMVFRKEHFQHDAL